MLFKNHAEMQYDYDNTIHPKLKALMIMTDGLVQFLTGKEMVVTSLIRVPSPVGKKSYHPLGRAFDFRIKITDKDGKNVYLFSDEDFKYIQKFFATLKSIDDSIQLSVHPELFDTKSAHYHIEYSGEKEGQLKI